MTLQYKVHYSLKPLLLLIQYSYTQRYSYTRRTERFQILVK